MLPAREVGQKSSLVWSLNNQHGEQILVSTESSYSKSNSRNLFVSFHVDMNGGFYEGEKKSPPVWQLLQLLNLQFFLHPIFLVSHSLKIESRAGCPKYQTRFREVVGQWIDI